MDLIRDTVLITGKSKAKKHYFFSKNVPKKVQNLSFEKTGCVEFLCETCCQVLEAQLPEDLESALLRPQK